MRTSLKTTNSILNEIENSLNDFKKNTERAAEVELRLRACNHAIKIHTLNFMIERYENFEKPKLPLIN